MDEFRAKLIARLGEGDKRVPYRVACFEACIPRSFWAVSAEDVTYNLDVFNGVIKKYVRRWRRALLRGYSLLLMGDNGCGKSMFVSYVLSQMAKRGCSVYYTTLAQLDLDIKRGFSDARAEVRLNDLLQSDFLVIDEVGKEHYRDDSYLNTRLELLLKTRYDDANPTILATNLDYDTLIKMYGPTIASMLEGKYQAALMESGDFRKSVATRMKTEMGFDE